MFNLEVLTVMSGSEMFKSKKFDQEVQIDGQTKSRRFTVDHVIPDPQDLRANDIFVCTARGGLEERLSKSELVKVLQAGCAAETWEPCAKCCQPSAKKCSKCKGHDLYNLSQDASSLRFVRYLAFQKDFTGLLKKVSGSTHGPPIQIILEERPFKLTKLFLGNIGPCHPGF